MSINLESEPPDLMEIVGWLRDDAPKRAMRDALRQAPGKSRKNLSHIVIWYLPRLDSHHIFIQQ